MVHVEISKPLHELTIYIKENGIQKEIPALNEKWKQNRCWTKYQPLPMKENKISESAQLEEWISETEWFIKDMEWLLELEHYVFWSTIIYDKSSMDTVISFTQEATPFYLSSIFSTTSNSNIRNLYGAALKSVLRVICRLITQKESDEHWMKKDFLADLLYKNYIISIPLIFDLLTAYGKENQQILTLMVQTIFKLQPKYFDDLKEGLQYFQKAFKTTQLKMDNDRLLGTEQSSSSLNDMALYTLDCAISLSILVEILPESVKICSEIQLEQSISNFYDNVLYVLYKNVYALDNENKSLEHLNNARIELLKCFRAIVGVNIDAVINEEENREIPADKFLCILTECLSDPVFVKDYQRHYAIEVDLEIIKQCCPNVDPFKLDFIQNAYGTFEETNIQQNGFAEQNGVDFHDFEANLEEEGAVALPLEIAGSASAGPSLENKIENDVKKVLDILPHLGDGFIRKLLGRYDNVESAISAILEGNLPPDLAEIDQSEPFIPSDKLDNFYIETGIDRLNVFDGDEFDVMTNDKIKGIMKKGKGFPGQAKTIKALLDDKSHLRDTKPRYQEYQIVCDEYDDEYDDSYDALVESETKSVRVTKDMKNILVDEVDDDEEETEDNGDEINETEQKNSLNFCENPEAIRQRYEDRRRAKFETRQGNNSSSNRDVIGKSKGQGQEKDVLLNRLHKNTNKSSRANHNRKQGATFKRNKGMIPS